MTTAAPDAVMTGSGTPGADFLQPVDAAVVKAELRRVMGKRGVLAIRAVPRWEDDPPLVMAGRHVRVLPCATALAVRDALTLRNDPHRPLVILTDLSPDQLGDGICDHLVARRPLLPDPWLSLRDRFGAEQQEADLLRNRESARDALRMLGDFPVTPAPGGVLTRDHLIGALTVHLFGLGDNGFTIVDVLVWSTDADHTRRFRAWLDGSTPDLAGDVFTWFAHTLGAPAAAIIAAWRHRDPADLLPLGLIAAVLENQGGHGDHDAAVALRARIEDAVGRVPLTDVALTGWAQSATLAADRIAAGRDPDRARFTAVQRRADTLATELLVGAFSECSDHLPSALDHRLELFAAAAENAGAPDNAVGAAAAAPPSGAMDAVESAWNRVQEHATVAYTPEADWSRDIGLAQAVLRLLRYSTEVGAGAVLPTDLASAVSWYRDTGSWVDAAVNDAFGGSDRPRLAQVAHRVLTRVRAVRAEQDVAVAALLAAAGTYRPVDPGSAAAPLMVEDLLDQVLLPLTTAPPRETNRGGDEPQHRSPVLLVVADGMSSAAANDVLVDIARRHAASWQQADLAGPRGPVRAVLAALPSVTKFSRCSLLSGRISSGEQAVETRQFAAWLTAHSLGSRHQVLFHKADIEAVSAGHALPQSVRAALDDTVGRPVVACVLNAIDDALDRSDPIGTRWTTSALHPLDALLHAAARVGRTVLLTSDHGHVVERRENPTRQRGQGLSARWRPAAGASDTAGAVGPAQDEVLVNGPRVVTDNEQAILAVSEQIRYSRGLKAGYHGGAALAEVVIPVAILVPGDVPSHLPLTPSGPRVPTWWVGADTATGTTIEVGTPMAGSGEAPPAERPRTRRTAQGVQPPAGTATEPGLFDPVTPNPANGGTSSSAGVTSVAGDTSERAVPDRIGGLLASAVFITNRQRFAAALPAEQIGRLLRALIGAGGSLTRPRAAAALGVDEHRVARVLAVVGQVVNIDGIVVLAQSGTEVTLQERLLYEQFGITG